MLVKCIVFTFLPYFKSLIPARIFSVPEGNLLYCMSVGRSAAQERVDVQKTHQYSSTEKLNGILSFVVAPVSLACCKTECQREERIDKRKGQMKGKDDTFFRPADSSLPDPDHHLSFSWGSIQRFFPSDTLFWLRFNPQLSHPWGRALEHMPHCSWVSWLSEQSLESRDTFFLFANCLLLSGN